MALSILFDNNNYMISSNYLHLKIVGGSSCGVVDNVLICEFEMKVRSRFSTPVAL